MNKFSKLLSFILVLCMLLSAVPFAFAQTGEEAAADEPLLEETADDEADDDADDEDEALAALEAALQEPAQWTVMLYLCGTDLESDGSMASSNLEMIKNTTANSAVNMVIETGGTKQWNSEEKAGIDIAEDKLQRWYYGEEGYQLVEELENANMAKYTTLADFISWSAEKYPAEKYMLVLWDHGSGSAMGLIVDELHDYAEMSLEGLHRALENGGVHFDLLMTDTCLMANLEMAQTVAPFADYLAASEEVMPGLGSNYEEWLQALYDEPECGPERLGRLVANATQLMYAEKGDDSFLKGLTFSLTDLSKIDPVAEAFNDLMKEAVELVEDPEAFGAFLIEINKTDRYQNTYMKDLYDLARRSINGGISKQTALKLENAVDEAVVYNIRGSYHPYAHGLSVYLRYSDTAKNRHELDRLIRADQNPWQLAFLDAVNMKWDAPEWVTDITGEIPQVKAQLYTLKFDTEVSEDKSQTQLRLYSGIEAGGFIRYELQRFDEQTQSWFYLGQSEDVQVVDLNAEDKSITITADFTGKWPSLAGEFLSVETKDMQDDTTVMMQAPVRLFGEKIMKLRILAHYPDSMMSQLDGTAAENAETEHTVEYLLTGIWDGYDSSTGLIDRNTYSMTELNGMPVEFCKPVYSDYKKEVGDMRYVPMTMSMDMEVTDEVLPAGQYRLRYSLTDMLDRVYYSDFFDLAWDGTNAVFSEPAAEAEAE